MATDINSLCLVGRLTRDPELKYTPGNTAIANFTLANNRVYVQNGEKKEQAHFFNCISWGRTGEIITQFARKGHRLIIEGRLQHRSWETKDGVKRSTIEVVVENFQFIESRKSNDQRPPEEPEVPEFDNCHPAGTFNDDNIPY